MTDTSTQSRMTPRRIVLGLVATLALVVGAGAIWMTLAPVSFWALLTPDYTGKDISVTEAHQRAVAGDIVLIDIRRPDEWKKTGVGEGAQPLDMRRDDFVEELTRIVGGNLDTQVALMCARGVRSAKMSKKLTEAGFTRIIDVPEGMLGSRAGPGWLGSDLPTRTYNEDS
jgi:rhodanese-related sulfurtransferase